MASKVKEKIKKKSTTKVVNQGNLDEERPSSAHSQISVKEAAAFVDNTEKFTEDESKQEKDEKNAQDQKSAEKDEDSHVKKKDKKKDKGEKKKDGKAKKSKHVTPPPKVEELPDPEPIPDKKRRSPSPFGRNTVEPTTTESNMGSLASIKSHSTVREAWTDRSSMSDVNTVPPSVASSVISVREAARENRAYLANQQQTEVASDSSDEEIEETEEIKNAYIPYLYAKKNIIKVIKDMKRMRSNHIHIVADIQKEYKSIEDETQRQFNIFVINLRDTYKGKVTTFRQVIDIHRTELQSKESYWNEMLESLAERNRRLLKEKKVLLIQNKVEIERLEKEKAEIQTDLSQKLDKATVALATVEKEKEEEKNKETNLQDEIKKLKEDLEKEKSGASELEKELAEEKRLRAAAGIAVVASATTTDNKPEAPVEVKKETPVTSSAAVSSAAEKKEMSVEREELEKERQRMIEERIQMEEDRKNYGGEKKEWMDQFNQLQQDIVILTKESSEWKVKYEMMKQQAEKSAGVQEKYAALEAQYQALAAIVSASEGTEAIAKENKKKTEDDRDMMNQEKTGLEKEIKQWEAQFKKKNGRQPTEEDKTDSVREMYVQQEELNTMVNSLDKKLETYQKLEKGDILDPPEVVQTSLKEPEVQTIEVKVPDPMVMSQLKKEQEEVEKLHEQIAELQRENTEKSSHISELNEELSKLRDKISHLEAALKAGTVAAVASSTDTEEVEALKKENKEMKKDIKKMLKKLEKVEEKAKSTDLDPDTRVQNLEERVTSLDEKITDIESENETLKEEKLKTETEKEALLQQIQTLQQQIVTPAVSPAVAVTSSTLVKSEPVDGCNVPAHSDLLEQLENKQLEIKEMQKQLQEKETQIQEKIMTIRDLEKELEKLRTENKDMRTDMLKMAKQHQKLQHKLKDLVEFEKTKKLLEAMAFYVHEIHGEVPTAAEGVTNRLELVSSEALKLKESQDKSVKAVEAWVSKFTKKNGREPTVKDRDSDGERAYKVLEENGQLLENKKVMMEALQIMKTGDYKAPESRMSTEAVSEDSPVEKVEQQMTALGDKLSDLESNNDDLRKERNDAVAKLRDLELQLEQAKSELQLQSTLASGLQDSQELSEQITNLQKQVNASESALLQEKTAHSNTQEELEDLKKQMEVLKEEVQAEKEDLQAQRNSDKQTKDAENKAKMEEINALKSRNEQLEMERLANVPVDTAKEIKDLQTKIAALEKEKSGAGTANATLQAQMNELKTKLEGAQKNAETQRAANRELEAKNKTAKADKDKAIKEVTMQIEKREQQRANEDKKRIATLERKTRELEAGGVKPVAAAVAVGGKAGSDAGDKVLKEQFASLKRENNELNAKIKQMDAEIKRGARQATTMGNEEKNDLKRKEKIMKELEKKYEIEKNKTSKLDTSLKSTEEELKVTKKERDEKENELKKVTAELSALGVAAKQGMEAATKVKTLETDNKKLTDENKVLTENYNSERVLRKKYYNMVEDMKGKIRVYCRARPLSSTETDRGNYSVVKSPDEYTINVESSRGTKEFQFDAIFMEESTQEKIFEDTNNLIQSAMDGYNVCIFAYGQTGSGKTFTMIGDRDQRFPGIAPRSFDRIYSLAHEIKNKFNVKVSTYMMELYNDRLIDLFAKPGTSDDERMDIKKDKKGLVYVQGSVIKEASNSKELFALFEEGSKNRHTASTKMNAESSRSHLIIGITIETTNKTTGQVLTGKLSLVDLAGSERVAKTGATAEQLKEAMSINKSLSALGDVISALSSDQQFIPYRNHKLTMLMQDSLGGNAKTLMFVNISPADYNQDETIISLMYASRVKLITNDASKNAENKEINRLKNIIAKLKKGETVNEDDE